MSEAFALCVSIRFLDTQFHGRRDGGRAEWPPSPMRLFQALVATAGRREPAGITERSVRALEWLERQQAPRILAPLTVSTLGRRVSVPNNAMDVVAAAWSRGNDSDKGDADPRTHRAMKTVRPTWLRDGTIHYLWKADPSDVELDRHKSTLRDLVRAVTALGWGIDLVAGELAIVADRDLAQGNLEHWSSDGRDADDGLRVPVQGSLAELRERHEAFTKRIHADGFTAPPPRSRFRVLDYRRSTDPAANPVAAFALLRLDGPGYRAFDTANRALTVSGMLRGATATAARATGWSEDRIARWVLGHGEARGAKHIPVGAERFAYLPLPSIEARGGGKWAAGKIRRVAITSFALDAAEEMDWARQALSAQELIDERSQAPIALLGGIPPADPILQRYTRPAASWVSVTPVVLPGYDDRGHLRSRANRPGITAARRKELLASLSDRIDALIRKALVQRGLHEALAGAAEVEWRKVPFIAGVAHADRYGVPPHLKSRPLYHVRLQFRDQQGGLVRVPGPLCIGGGRYGGLGLFVANE